MAKQQTVVEFGEGHELSLKDFQETLLKYHRHQAMIVSTGARRKPDRTDRLAIPVMKNGKIEKGWWLGEVQSNWNDNVGETRAALTFESSGKGIWLSYIAHTEELRVLPAPIPQPVYP